MKIMEIPQQPLPRVAAGEPLAMSLDSMYRDQSLGFVQECLDPDVVAQRIAYIVRHDILLGEAMERQTEHTGYSLDLHRHIDVRDGDPGLDRLRFNAHLEPSLTIGTVLSGQFMLAAFRNLTAATPIPNPQLRDAPESALVEYWEASVGGPAKQEWASGTVPQAIERQAWTATVNAGDSFIVPSGGLRPRTAATAAWFTITAAAAERYTSRMRLTHAWHQQPQDI